jgi:carboxypeptidase Q
MTSSVRLLALSLVIARPLYAQYTVDTTGAGQLVAEAADRSEVMANLEHLSDAIGPRLTGSAAMRKANEWTAKRFTEYGLTSRLEPWQFGVTWQRGPASLRITAPFERSLVGHSWAWTAGTSAKTLSGPVVRIDASTAESIAVYAPRARGAWLLLRPAVTIWNPDGPPMTAADSVAMQEARRRQFPQAQDTSEAARKARQQFGVDRPYLLRKAGALGILTDGSKEYALMNMSGSPNSVSPLPNVVIAHEDYALFDRLIRAGITPRVEGRIDNRLGKSSVMQWNTVAEIPGIESPGQVVILGAHLDSWDLGTGVTDNGAGSMVVLEAARVIAQSGLKPRRTIRFILFSGEEQGLLGSRAYATAHAAETDSIQAVLVLDNGTGMITGQALQGRDELEQLWKDLLAPVASLGANKVRQGNKGGTDHLAFVPYGVPAFNFDQESRGYNHTHHSQLDTYDHALPSDLRQAAAVMVVTAFELANLPELLPRGNRTPVTPPTVLKPTPGVGR